MSILKYEALMKTLELGSLTKAAERLGYTQSAVSQMLNSLEIELGVTLIKRSRSGISLTEEGSRLLPYIEELQNSYHVLKEQAALLSGSESGTVRIGGFPSITAQWLPDILKSFRQRYPNINFEMLTGEYVQIDQWVDDGTVDVGFRRMAPQHDVEYIRLLKEKQLAVLPKNHPLAELETIPMEKLKAFPFIYPATSKAESEANQFPGLDMSELDVRYRMYDYHSIIPMVEQDLGISILPELVLRRTPYDVVIKEMNPPVNVDLWLILKSKQKASVAVKCFVDYILETL